MKAFRILGILAVSAALFSCAKEELPDDTASGQEETDIPEGFEAMTFTASISELTKAAFTGTKVNWEESDRIAVYDGTCRNEFRIRSIENGMAVFEGAVTEGAEEFHAVFPYAAASETLPAADGTFSVVVPSEQQLGSSTSDTDAIVSVAKADDVDHFQFRNIVSMVKISIPDGVTSVKFSSVAKANLAGACTVKIGEAAQRAQEESVTLVSDSETGVFSAGDYWVAVVPATLPEGCLVEYEGNGQTASVEVPGALDLVRNSSMDITSETSDVRWVKTSITTADELMAFAQSAGTYTADDLVVLGADIDMSGKEWVPFELGCTFDGKRHRVYNLTSDDGTVFSNIKEGAVLKNVTFGSQDGSGYDNASTISMTGTAGNTGLVGTNYGTIENVVNYVPVVAESAGPAAQNEVRVGGIAGSNYGIILDCINNGDISLTGSSDKMIFIGGITGWASKDSERIENSSNSGSITIDNQNAQAAAGIAGMIQGGDIVSCSNSGKITVSKSSAKNSYFGGIAGFVQIHSTVGSRIENCTNTGEFDLDNTSVFGAGGIVGIIHRYAFGSVIISGCENSADVFMSKQQTKEDVNLGGIAGMCDVNTSGAYTGANVISSCTNSGKVYYEESRSGQDNLDGKFSTAGGIIGRTNNTLEITGCTNSGAVSSDKISLDYLGGIAGYVNSGTVISGCTNTADVTLDLGTSKTYSGGNRPGAGGIACYTGGTVTIEDCENSGAVSITISKSDQCAAGGIVATTEGTLTLSRNTNNGSVTSTSGNQDKAAGGILGRAMRTVTMKGNTNTGAVSAYGANGFDNDNVMAGGLIGLIDGGAAGVPTIITVTGDMAACAVKSSVGRAGLLFAIMNGGSGSYQPKATFTDCKIGGSVEGKVKDGSETSGAIGINSENYDDYSFSYQGASANLTIDGLEYVSIP